MMRDRPRNIPLFTSLQVLLGRGMTMIGWIVLSLCLALTWLVIPYIDVSFLYFTGEVHDCDGKIVEVVETNVEVNEHSVWVHIFEYTDASGVLREDDSFATGKKFSVGDRIRVEYPVAHPQRGRIADDDRMRTAELSTWLLLIYVLPAIGVLMILVGIRRGYRDVHLLQTGILVDAELREKKATNTQINDERVYALTFEFMTVGDGAAGDGTGDVTLCTKTLKTHKTERFEDEACERLLYDAQNPQGCSTLVDDLPGTYVFDQAGELTAGTQVFQAWTVISPLLWLLPHVIYVLVIL